MNHETLIQYSMQKPGTSLRYPFDPNLPVLFVGECMFALLGSGNGKPSVNLKADPETVWLSRQQYPQTVLPGYHMNKNHWNTVVLDGTVPEQELLHMVDESYQLVLRKIPKAMRDELGNGGK